MKNLFSLTGSIAKKEVLLPINNIVLENTAVYEASDPYTNYYGQLPTKATPNSLFLFTQQFLYLEEILSCSQQLEKCLLDQINIASAVIAYKNKQYPAIRIKNFPDYSRLSAVQNCLIEQGIVFTPSLTISGEIEARINKLFVLEKVGKEIYFDLVEDHKGYIFLNNKINALEFKRIITLIRNSSACKLFDAVQGELILNGNVVEFIRVFAEGLDLHCLTKLQKEFSHAVEYSPLKNAHH